MSEPNNEMKLPKLGDKLVPRSYLLGLTFHPQIKLDKKKGFDFAQKLTDCVDPQGVQLTDSMWVFAQPLGTSAGGGLAIRVEPTALQIEGSYPTHHQEWFEQRYQTVLDFFGKLFKPKLILSSTALMRGILDVDGDARHFLAQSVMRLENERMGPLKRPIHLLGLRLFLPPFVQSRPAAKGKKSKPQAVTDWHVELKVESLLEDPRQLFLEANATWPTPHAWNSDGIIKAVGRLATVSKYLEENVLAFLRFHGPGSEEKP